MSKFFLLPILALLGTTSAAQASECDDPKPSSGEVVAICGDQMITYVGDEQMKVLGIVATTSRFELSYCSDGRDRKTLDLSPNSEGYKLKYQDEYSKEAYTVIDMWNEFKMEGIQKDGKPLTVPCQVY